MNIQTDIKQLHIVTIYSAVHLLVDLSCACLMFRRISAGGNWYLALLLYNFCAFALQLPAGILADRAVRLERWAVLGCLLCALAFAPWMSGYLPVLSAGLGNALFHVAGGTRILCISRRHCSKPGIFVSTGALGIFLGTMWGRHPANPAMILVFLLLLSGVLLSRTRKTLKISSWEEVPAARKTPPSEIRRKPAVGFALSCLFLVVCLRSYQGMILNFPWKISTTAAFAIVLGTAAGKLTGGLIADRFGLLPAAVVSLTLSALCFLASAHPWAGVSAVFLFNMTMPMTLTAIHRLFPRQPGFSFGLLTFTLFLGFLPVYGGFGVPDTFSPPRIALLTLVSLILAVCGLCHRSVSEYGGEKS